MTTSTEALTLRQFVDRIVDEQLAKNKISGVQREVFLEKMHAMVRPIVEFAACFNLLFPDEATQQAVAQDFLASVHAQASVLINTKTDTRYSREVQEMLERVKAEYETRMTPITLMHDPAAFQRALDEADTHP